MSDDPFVLNALGQHVTARMVRTLYQEVQHRHFAIPEWAQAHPVQKVCVVNTTIAAPLVDTTKNYAHDLAVGFPMTIGGISLKIDDKMPDDVIEFYRGSRLVGKIINLGKPPGL
jgi:hypothetical protein